MKFNVNLKTKNFMPPARASRTRAGCSNAGNGRPPGTLPQASAGKCPMFRKAGKHIRPFSMERKRGRSDAAAP